MNRRLFPLTNVSGVGGFISLRHSAAFFLVTTFLAACGAPYSPGPLPPGHPASRETAEAPLPLPSHSLETADVVEPLRSSSAGQTSNGEQEPMKGMKGMKGMPGMDGMEGMPGGHQ
jgi:hypothetical protein